MVRLFGLALVALASTASGQRMTIDTNNPAPKKGPPDRIVCEKVEQVGTRLGAKKVCLTVAQWEERRMSDREHTEKIQSSVCVPAAGC